MKEKNKVSATQVAIFIYNVLKGFPSSIAVMMLVAVFGAIELSLTPYIFKTLLDSLENPSFKNYFDTLIIPIIAYLSVSFVSASLWRVYGYFVEIKMIPHLREQITLTSFQSLLSQSHSYYQERMAGSLTNKINDLKAKIPDILQIIIDRFFSRLIALCVAIYVLSWVSDKFSLFVLVWVLVFCITSFTFSKRVSELSRAWSKWESSLTGQMVDIISNIMAVRLFARGQQEESYLKHTFQGAIQTEQQLHWFYLFVWCFYEYSFIFIQGLNLYFLVKGRQAGEITIGDFSLVLAINGAIISFLKELARDLSDFSEKYGKVSRALSSILVKPEIKDRINATPLIVKKGEIIFNDVLFQYKEAYPLFQGLSLIIKPGQKVGLVGYSGSGKTTFINLILRQFDVTRGSILIDNQNIQEVKQDSLRENIGVIPQDPFLFHRMLLENIRYGKIDASDKEVIQAAKNAHAHEFIGELPKGYASLVGERGVKLSGGQRQRIALARIFLKNAPILILDEATSQLDSVTENYIQEALWTLMQGKTAIAIAHRLSTLKYMDRILVFEKGKIIEDGTHDSLLTQESLYKILWNAQSGGFLPH